MAISFTKMTNGAVKVTDGSLYYTLNNLSNVKIIKTTLNTQPALRVTWGADGELKFLVTDIGTINGAAAPGTLDAIRDLLATAVFNFGGGNGTGVTQAQMDTAIAAAVSTAIAGLNLATTYKRKDQFLDLQVALDFPVVPAYGTASLAITIPNSSSGDRILIGNSSNLDAGIILKATATGGGNVSVRAMNITAADINPANGTYRFTVIKENAFS